MKEMVKLYQSTLAPDTILSEQVLGEGLRILQF